MIVLGAVLVLMAIVLIVQLVRHMRARPKPVVPPPPAHERAYAALRALHARDLISAGLIKEYYYELSLIVRHYIENRFGLRAPEQTTEEFLYSLGAGSILRDAHRAVLSAFLTESDLVKFANQPAGAADAQRAHDRAVAFIEETRVRETPRATEGG